MEQYDQHFWRNGHSVPIVVFDDPSPANQEKYFPLLERTRTHNELYYVGPREKENLLAYVIKGAIELWPTLVEIRYFQKTRHRLPQLRVANQRL